MKQVFSTKDLGLAGALCAYGYRITKTEKEGRSVVFYFDQEKEIEDIAQNYFTGALKLDALTYNMELKKLRKIIGAYYRTEDGKSSLEKKEEDDFLKL